MNPAWMGPVYGEPPLGGGEELVELWAGPLDGELRRVPLGTSPDFVLPDNNAVEQHYRHDEEVRTGGLRRWRWLGELQADGEEGG